MFPSPTGRCAAYAMDVSTESRGSILAMREVKHNEDSNRASPSSGVQRSHEHRAPVEDLRRSESGSGSAGWRDALPTREVNPRGSGHDVPARGGWQQLHLWRRESAFPSDPNAGQYATALLDRDQGSGHGHDSSG